MSIVGAPGGHRHQFRAGPAGGFSFAQTKWAALLKFVLLVVVMGATSYCLIRTSMYAFGWNVLAAKVASELLLYLANFGIQRDFIFGDAASDDRDTNQDQAAEAPPPLAARRAA